MIRKIKYVLLILLVIMLFIILYIVFKEPINKIFIEKEYEKQIVDFSNFKSFKNISDVSIENYNYYKNYYNEPNIDISPLIESYIKQVETDEENPFGGKYAVRLISNMEREIQSEDYTYIVKMYHGSYRKLSIEELEKVLVHKGNDKYTGWCIPKDSPEIIDLPYNYYLKYEPSDFKLLDKVKKVTKCTFLDPIDSIGSRKEVIVEYIDNNNAKHSEKGVIYISEKDNYMISLSLNGLYYSQTHNAKVELKNYDYDKWAIEKAKREKDEPWNLVR